MQQQVENRDEETLELKETYSSLQQEVDIKTKKLKKVAALTTEPKPFPPYPPVFIHQCPIVIWLSAIQIAVLKSFRLS